MNRLVLFTCAIGITALVGCGGDDDNNRGDFNVPDTTGDVPSTDGGTDTDDASDVPTVPGLVCGEGTVERDGACIPTDAITCGSGTRLFEGRCVPAARVECGPGTSLVDGSCVIDASTCAPGTSFDDETEQCVPDVACGDGTIAVAGGCVPDGSTICGPGTQFDDGAGRCVLDASACGEGTILVEGVCVDTDTALDADVMSAEEPDDPRFGGEAATFELAPDGETVTLGGCITPEDFDESGTRNPDVDWFVFEAEGPTYLEITAVGVDGLAAGFAIADGAPDDALGVNGITGLTWRRAGASLTGTTSGRTVFVPRTGTYTIAVFDTRSLDLNTLDLGFAWSRAVGSEDTCYLVQVTSLGDYDATSFATGVFEGETGGTTFLDVDVADGQVVESGLSWNHPGSRGAYVVVNDDTYLASSGAGFFGVPGGGQVLIVVEAVYDLSLDDGMFELALTPLPAAPSDGVLTLDSDTVYPVRFGLTATDGDVVHLSFTTAPSTNLATALLSPTGDPLPNLCGSPPCSAGSLQFVSDAGTYVLVVRPVNDDDVVETDFEVSLVRYVPEAVAEGGTANLTFVDRHAYIRTADVDLTWLLLTASNLVPDATPGVTFVLRPDVRGPLQPALQTTGIARSAQRIFGPAGSSPMLIAIVAPEPGVDEDPLETARLTVQDAEFREITLEDGPPVSFLFSLAGDEEERLLIYGPPVAEATVGVSAETATPRARLLRTDGTNAAMEQAGGPGAVANVSAKFGLEGWHAFAVDAGGANANVSTTVSYTPPPYGILAREQAYASICPSDGGIGTQLIVGDNAITSLRTFDTFTYTFFGESITQYRIDTNGWIVFSDAYTGESIATAPTPGEPLPPGVSRVVAPSWADLTTRVCVLESPERFLVEWQGSTVEAPAVDIRMQTIFRSSGEVEFVYGTAHQLVDDVFVGLIAPNGTDYILYTEGPIPAGGSLLFAPPAP